MKILLLSILIVAAPLVHATTGMQPIAVGAVYKSLAGAGVAYPNNSFIAVYNPAGLVDLTTSRFDVSVGLFNPERSFRGDGVVLDPAEGEVVSRDTLFVLPAVSKSFRLNEKSAWALTMFPKGGGSVVWQHHAVFRRFNAGVGANQSGEGVSTKAELQQMLIAATYSRKVGRGHSIGVAPLIGFQRFRNHGIGYFRQVSADPSKLSDNGFDNSFGYGGMVGWQWNATSWLNVGASYQSEIVMQKFEEYAGLFANQGEFNMAPQWTVGVVVSPLRRLKIALDYQRIAYSAIPALSNPHDYPLVKKGGLNTFAASVGADASRNGGAGFGWDDVNIYKVGVEYRYSDTLDLRAGYSYNNCPIGSEDVLFNILATAVTKEHLAFGFSKRFSKNKYQIDLTYIRGFKNSVKGNNPDNWVDNDVEISMEQNTLEIGFSKLI
ncbi:MAG: outer membrane protein transport protein [Bacteriovoracaceae bacterium]|nr:outer membrane protein transport protein [Bacteriovoracaceae bacterium]